jgi:hypothetical protein
MNVASRAPSRPAITEGDTPHVIDQNWRPIAAMTAPPAAEPVFEVVQDDYAKLPEWFHKAGAGQWTAIPHAVWEKLGRAFPLITIRVYCAIAQETWGTTVRERGPDGKLVRDDKGHVLITRREWCEEPQDEIKRRLGVGKSTVAEAIAQLVRYKLTIRAADPRDRRRARYKNDLYALLAFDADSVEDEDPAEASTPAASKTASALRAVAPHEPLILLAGEKNRPFVLGEQRGRISNESSAQVAVKFSMLDDGEIDFAICDLPTVDREGEKKANPIGDQSVTEKIHPETRMYSDSDQSLPAANGGDQPTPSGSVAVGDRAQPWIDVEREATFARFTAVVSTLSTRLHAPPPALSWRKQEYARLMEAGVPLDVFEARFKLRAAALTSYGGVTKVIDDVIAAAKANGKAAAAPPDSEMERQFAEFDYDGMKARALDEAMQNLEPREHDALKKACQKELAASDPKWGLLTVDQRWLRVDVAIRAKVRDQLKLPTFQEFLSERRP